MPLFPVLPVLPAALSALAGRTVSDLALLLALAALVGLVEEVVFRGLLLQWLVSRGGPWKAAVLSSVAFGVVHFVNLLVGSEMSATFSRPCTPQGWVSLSQRSRSARERFGR